MGRFYRIWETPIELLILKKIPDTSCSRRESAPIQRKLAGGLAKAPGAGGTNLAGQAWNVLFKCCIFFSPLISVKTNHRNFEGEQATKKRVPIIHWLQTTTVCWSSTLRTRQASKCSCSSKIGRQICLHTSYLFVLMNNCTMQRARDCSRAQFDIHRVCGASSYMGQISWMSFAKRLRRHTPH